MTSLLWRRRSSAEQIDSGHVWIENKQVSACRLVPCAAPVSLYSTYRCERRLVELHVPYYCV